MNNKQTQIHDQSGPTIIVEGEEYDYFFGGDYLGLKDDPIIRSFVEENIVKHSFTKGPSYLGIYPDIIDEKFAETVTQFLNCEEILNFPSGYFGNGVLTRYLSPRINKIFIDEFSHYSMFDGATLSGKPIITFPHRDVESLEKIMDVNLKSHEIPLIMTDGVFVVTGNLPPIPEYISLLEKKNHGSLIVDDAHGMGTMGTNGRGTVDHFQVNYDQIYTHASITKAIGSHGGILPGTHKMIQSIKERKDNVYKGPTGISNIFKLIAIKSFEIMSQNPQRVENLQNNSIKLKKILYEIGIDVEKTPSPIIGLTKQNTNGINLAKLADFLYENKIITYFRESNMYSGIPEGGGLKIVVNTNHTDEQINRFSDLIEIFKKKF